MVDPTGDSEVFEHSVFVNEDTIETGLSYIMWTMLFCPRLKPQDKAGFVLLCPILPRGIPIK